jgi:hypothetical protein
MLTACIITAFVVAFALLAIIGHALLFTAVVFGRGTVFAEKGAQEREPAPGSRPQLT